MEGHTRKRIWRVIPGKTHKENYTEKITQRKLHGGNYTQRYTRKNTRNDIYKEKLQKGHKWEDT